MTNIVVATRNGLAEGPDGTKYRLARGRTLADARHPLAQAHPDLFAPYTIELSVDEPGGDAAAERGDVPSWPDKVAEVEQVAEGYRAQLAAIAEGLHARGLVPAELDTTAEGWLAALVFAVIDGPAAEQTDPPAAAAPAEPDELPKPRKRAAPRPRPSAEE